MNIVDDLIKNTLIVMTTFNRKDITKICLKNIDQTRQGMALAVLDDYSKEYSLDELKSWTSSDRVLRAQRKLGINDLRLYAHNLAISEGFKYIYHIDNDALHDPNWITQLAYMRTIHNGILCLYNTHHHFAYTIKETPDMAIRRATPGISFFYELSQVKNLPDRFYNSWDFVFGDVLGPSCVSKTSYVEHFGAGGIHNHDFDRDRAHNPTPYLIQERVKIIKELTSKE